MKKLFLSVVLAIMLFASTAIAKDFNINIANTSSTMVIALVVHIDHNFPRHRGPVGVIGAELQSGDVFNSKYKRYYGDYAIMASIERTGEITYFKAFSVRPDVTHVTIIIDEEDVTINER